MAETLRFLAAASAIAASAWRLIAFRFSCCSFCSRGVIAFLSGFENEGVIFQQRDGISGEFIEQRIAQPERRLRAARASLLAQDPQRSPQNRPMVVTPKPANENAV